MEITHIADPHSQAGPILRAGALFTSMDLISRSKRYISESKGTDQAPA